MFFSVSRVEALHRERNALVELGVGENLLGLVGALGGVLGVLHREPVREAGAVAHLGDRLGDVHVALLDPEVRVADEDVLDRAVGEPLQLAVQAIELELRHLARGGGAPVAKRALERAAAIGLPQTDPLLVGIVCDQLVEHAVEERRRQLPRGSRMRSTGGVADELAVGGEIADAAHAAPVARRQAG